MILFGPCLELPHCRALDRSSGYFHEVLLIDKPTFTAFSFAPYCSVWIVGAATLLLGVFSSP